MLKPFSKIQSLTLALLLTIMTTITAAYALPPFKAKSNLPAVSAPVANPFANLQLNYNTNTGNTQTGGQSSGGKVEGTQKFPIVIGDDSTPDTVPNRPCILMPPEYYNPIDPWDRWMIPVTWYEDVFNTFSGYLIDAQDTDSDGRYNSVADFLADALTHALPVNSFNNFCFKGGPTNHSGPPGQDWNPYVDDDGDGEYNEDPPGYGDEDGDGDTNEDGWPSQGFDSYPTLDLYVGNENSDFGTDSLDNDYFVVDERKFLVATKCNDPNSSTADINEAYDANDVTCDGQFSSLTSYYALEDEMDVEIGDIVRFGVYVHNNALYPNNPAAVADDVLLQFDTKTNPNNPRAAISSPDNIYHQDPYDTGSSTLRDTFDLDNDGNTTEILRMATDTSRVNSTVPIELTPIEGATWLYNGPVAESAPNANNAYHVPFRITSGSTTTIQDYGTPPATPITITFDPSINQEDHELLIDQIPGCFEFAGWYFFDYRVAAGTEPLCTELDMQWMQQWPTYETLPVIEDEFIPPADSDPPIPVGYSDGTDEGLYIIGETSVPLIVQVNRNGYDGDLIWELLMTDIAGNINPYQPTVEHFCSNAAIGIQQNNCSPGTVLSDNANGVTFNRFASNTNSTLGSAYQQDTYKVYNLNRNVVLRIYAPMTKGDKKSSCREAVFMPLCTDMTLVTPSTLEDFSLDLTTGIEIEVDTVPDYYNGPIIFGTSNSCGVFDIDDLGANFANDPEPVLNPATNQYEVQIDFGVNDPKVAWYNIDTTEPGCSLQTGDGDIITINSLSDKGERCAENFTVIGEEPPMCLDNIVEVQPDVYLDDSSTAMNVTVNTVADPGWTGYLAAMVCPPLYSDNLPLCTVFRDFGVQITNVTVNPPGAFTNINFGRVDVNPIQNGDEVTFTVDNMANETDVLAVFAVLDPDKLCNDVTPFEWCGDGIVNDGEECDPADPSTPECTDTCELPEGPAACQEVVLNVTPQYVEDDGTVLGITIDVSAETGWSGQLYAMVCPPAFAGTFGTCLAFADIIGITNEAVLPSGAALNINPTYLEVIPVSDGDQITFDLSGIDDPTNTVAVFAFPDPNFVCEDNNPFEYCGDTVLNDGEECDDGNNLDDDGCSSICEDEIVIPPLCGDGTQDPGEDCDDGNNTNGDGCSATCEDEIIIPPFCGDGTQDPGENCDDGNNLDGDGCSAICEDEIPEPVSCDDVLLTVEPTYLEEGSIVDGAVTVSADTGWSGNLIIYVCENPTSPVSCLSTLDPMAEINGTPNTPSGFAAGTVQNGDMVTFEVENISNPNMSIAAFTAGIGTDCSEDINFSFCGDGTEDAGETCDDGNNLDDDGCSATCEIEEPEIPELCGDGILDTDGVDNVPNNADDIPENDDDEACDDGLNNGNGPSECRIDCSLPICGDGIQDLTEDCDDGALNGTEGSECTVSCEIEEEGEGGPPGDEGSATCTDLNITSASNISSIPAFIVIETNPSYWGETNIATFNYTSSNPSGIFSSNDGIGAGGFWNTNDKSVLYTGNIGDTISVGDSVQQYGGCSDAVTLSQTPLPPDEPTEPTEPGEPGEPGGPGDDGGGPGDGGPDGGGGGCPGITIIEPVSKEIADQGYGYIRITYPSAAVYGNMETGYSGNFTYHASGENVRFIDATTAENAVIIQNFINYPLSAPAFAALNAIAQTDDDGLQTTSKEVFYYNVNMNADTTILVTDSANESPQCGDTLQNYEDQLLTGPILEKFGWIHPTGGNTTNQPDYDVNYQITYRNNDSDITSVQITDTIGENNQPGKIYGSMYPEFDDYVNWSSSNEENRFVNLNTNPAQEIGIDTYYYGIGMHWIQNTDSHTWAGDNAQIPDCNELTGEMITETDGDGNITQVPSIETNLEAGNLCFDGRIDTENGITINNMYPDTIVKFEYEGVFHANDFYDACQTSFPGTESFFNHSIANPLDGTAPDYTIQDTETLYATCNYLLTRNAGDVLFYTDSDPGANLAALTEDQTRNSDGLVFINKILDSIGTFFGGGVSGSTTPSKCDDPDVNNILHICK